MKKFLALMLAAILAISALAACGKTQPAGTDAADKTTEAAKEDSAAEDNAEDGSEAAEDETAPAADDPFANLPENRTEYQNSYVVATPEMYPNIDFSKPYTCYVYSIGGKPNDWDMVEEKINERLAAFNTKIVTNFIGWSDLSTMYSLVLTGGEDIDIIFTAPWCQMYTENDKESFFRFDEAWLEENMPLTWRFQDHRFFKETTINGEMIAVSCNNEKPENKIVAIRQDLADKYGISELKDWEDYKNFMFTIAEKETPESGIFAQASSGSNPEVQEVWYQQYDTFYLIKDGGMSFTYSYNGGVPEWSDIQWTLETDMFRDFCYEMKAMADAGCWSRGALNNTVSDDDAFAALQGASIAWNGSVFGFMRQAEDADASVKCAAYDLTSDKLVKCEEANNGDMAIASASKDKERAAMVLDLMKMDTEINRLIHLGIEGVHYELADDGRTFTALDKAADYGNNSHGISWGLHNGIYQLAGGDEREQAMYDAWEERMVGCPTVTFVFDKSNVSEYCDAIIQITGDYTSALQLGLVDDVDAEIDEMIQRCNDAGLDIIKEELQKQFEAWLATQ